MRNKRHWHKVIELLRNKPHAIGAEIGVHRGLFANRLFRNLPNIQKYYCIDPWILYDDYKKTLRKTSTELRIPKNNAYQYFLNKTSNWQHKRIILRMTSVEALEHVGDNILDWVFIDGNHAYEYARSDITGWSKKVKIGGLIAGHDYFDNFRGQRQVPFGVKRAVHELIPEFKTERGPNVWWTWRKTADWVKE